MKKDYLSRLGRAVRWRLGAKEGAEVAADYREIVGDPPRPEEELVREVGKPQAIAVQLADERAYRLWLAVFLMLAACLAVAGTSPLPGGNYLVFRNWYVFEWLSSGLILAVVGAAGAIVWFRWKGWRTEKLPQKLPVLLAVLAAWIIVVLVYDWAWMHNAETIWSIWGEMPALLGPGRMVSRFWIITGEALEWLGGLGTTVIGICTLVKARMGDRRWAAVYVLAMTAMLVSMETLTLLMNMDISGGVSWESSLASYFYTYAVIAAVGLAGTGVALC